MVNVIDHEDLERLMEEYFPLVERFFLETFDDEWLQEFEHFLAYAVAEKQERNLFSVIESEILDSDKTKTSEVQEDKLDPFLASECMLMNAWYEFLAKCYIKKIVVGQRQSERLLNDYVPGFERKSYLKGKHQYADINLKKAFDFTRDLEEHRIMGQVQIKDFITSQLAAETEAREVELEKIARVAGKKLALIVNNYRPERTDQQFGQAIREIVDILVTDNIACSAEDLVAVLEKYYSNLPYYLKQSPMQYRDKLAQTKKPKPIKPRKKITIDVKAIASHLVDTPLEPLETIVLINEAADTITINGQVYKLNFVFRRNPNGTDSLDKENFSVFVKLLHTITEITEPMNYSKRLKQLLDMLQVFACRKLQEEGFAKYILKAYKIHQEKYLETIKGTSKHSTIWINRFSALATALLRKHTKLTDCGMVS